MNHPNVPGSFKIDDLRVRVNTRKVGAFRELVIEGHWSGGKSGPLSAPTVSF